ncbi:MAG: glycogen synthase GlgA [Endomicrobia bacterium]|nr:glycogen synthase GlgA [Endomicrobiia bacterium]MCL2799532.1 glycogen synthase GlgA [Endomicrobiia bacterium]
MNILMVASECVPFVKVGGLADVVGSLPKYLKNLGHDVRVIIPKYRTVDGKKYDLQTLPYRLQVKVGKDTESFRIKYCEYDGIIVYFIENMRFFNRPGTYGDSGMDYGDNRERFIFFCRAALESVKALMFRPDIIHCHDWETGLIPAYLKTNLKNDGFFWNTSSVFTIHNIAYQGMFPAETVETAGFSWEDFTPDKLEFHNNLNCMKCGIQLADAVSTVSPTYALEIKEFNGRGMEIVLNSRKDEIYGILNGVDYEYWNPSVDKYIAANYSKGNVSGKKICKAELQKLCGFDVDENAYLFGCVSRLDNQKGFDIITDAVYKLSGKNMQFVILGSGDQYIQYALQEAKKRMPKNVAVFFGHDEPLAHKIYAGCDAYMMPSRFEPCGLSQIISLAYGTIPIVNRTGGLSDTIVYYNHYIKQGNGFMFNITYGEDFVQTILKSEKIFNDKQSWNTLVQNAFKSDFSWDKSVLEYDSMYSNLMDKKRYETVFVRS